MRSVTDQPSVDRRSVIADASATTEAGKAPRTLAHTTIGYDGATGRATMAPAYKVDVRVNWVSNLTQHLVDSAAQAVTGDGTPKKRLRGLFKLANLAETHPTSVREALRYQPNPRDQGHKLEAYTAELGKSIGSEGARGYMTQMSAFADKLTSSNKPKLCLVNATFTGGGVAEMFQTQANIHKQLGIDVEWQKTWDHDGAYGEIGRKAFDAFQGGGKVISGDEHARWGEHNALLARVYQGMFTDGGVSTIFLEDHHAIHLIPVIKKLNPEIRIVWRSHVDMAGVLDGKKAGTDVWEKTILPNLKLLGPNDAVFFQPGSVPPHAMLKCNVFVCPPGIDPLATKNQRITADQAKTILKEKVKDLDLSLKYTATGGRFVPWKGNVLVTRAFLSIADDYPEVGLFVFAGIGTGDERKTAERDRFDASLAERPHLAKRVFRMDDQSGSAVGAVYALAADSHSPVVLGSTSEGYGLTGDEAGRQGAVPVTFMPGGFSRYGDCPETKDWQMDADGSIEDIIAAIPDVTQMYPMVDGKVVPTREALALEKVVADKLRALYDARRKDPEGFAKRYEEAANAAHTITLEHSSPIMARNYLAVAAASSEQLQEAAKRVKSQGAAHVACVADVLGESLWGTG